MLGECSFLKIMVVVIIGILAAVVVPQFGGVTDDARAAATSGAVSGVRASIPGDRTRAILTGQACTQGPELADYAAWLKSQN